MMSSDRDPDGVTAEQIPFYLRTGVDQATAATLAAHGNSYAARVSVVPRGFRRIADGMVLTIGGQDWRVVVGRGHAPEHACLHCPALGVLIAGDQVLPKISPNVSVWPTEPDGNPLARYLASLAMLRGAIGDNVLVLPSHKLPFHGLHARIDQLAAHHRERLDAILAVCDAPHSALEIVPLLFRRALDNQQLVFALGEALAHLHLLTAEGKLQRDEGADGIYRFRRVA
jgi:glyoxylase-like metal-dependent hydrolase (beta-lactamase superfamily II)